jgi:hypothetical protein
LDVGLSYFANAPPDLKAAPGRSGHRDCEDRSGQDNVHGEDEPI